ncbi:MAG: 16S rRNA (cytosine(967)-C(5))-methyltransferase RsmB [Clostridia bacterium]|nr:16S rRNA (cytosine(967)-C(5))-methyltransferase RsmB [Clostridia bacterium]
MNNENTPKREHKDNKRPFNRDHKGGNRPPRRFDGKKPMGQKPAGPKPEAKTDAPKPVKKQGGDPRIAALKAVEDVINNGAYASQALDRALSAGKLADADRRLAASLFYTAIENRLCIDAVLKRLSQADDTEAFVHNVLSLAAAQILFMDRIPDHAAVDEAVKTVRRTGREWASGYVNGVLRNLIRLRDSGEPLWPGRDEDGAAYLSLRYSVAPAAVERLIAAYGMDEAERLIAFAPKSRTTCIRPNRLRIDGAGLEKLLNDNHITWHRGTVPGSYHVVPEGSIAEMKGYREGLFSVQSESSMLAALTVNAKPRMQVLDACAAPGGKTCLMAEQMSGVGRIYAWDLHEHRVALIRAAAARLGIDIIRPAVHDATQPLESMLDGMDAVLVDAPCSGLGVLADKPDLRFRANEETFEAMKPLQQSILDAASKMVAPNGTLVYSTCTILPQENGDQVKAFLETHPDFELDTDPRNWPETLRDRIGDGMVQLLPGRDGEEGFFIARMKRRRV